jgi:VIT1/CCC1 family predicted Fe2+/Mn2+ transporter
LVSSKPMPQTEGRTEAEGGKNAKLNWLRAAVLGANDGIVSVAGIVLGVAGATTDRTAIFTAGLAGLVAGALSMAAGEYISVSSQRDTERAYIEKERYLLEKFPKEQLEELAETFEKKGLSGKTAKAVAAELTDHDAIKAHLDAEFNIDEEDLTNPWHAALASMTAFTGGALIPLLSVVFTPASAHLTATVVAVVIALVIAGYLSAVVSNASRWKATVRVVVGGVLAMAVTYGIGSIVGAHI